VAHRSVARDEIVRRNSVLGRISADVGRDEVETVGVATGKSRDSTNRRFG
jgi:VIT1/CCC1 family predicted Fe2+/Mn2+ transporter